MRDLAAETAGIPVGQTNARRETLADDGPRAERTAAHLWLDELTGAAGAPTLAPELRAILESSAVSTQLEVYRRLDEEASRQQHDLMFELTGANVSLLLAGVLSGLVLAGAAISGLVGEFWTERLALWAGVGTLGFGAVAAMLTYRARESDRQRRWLTMRSRAEMARIAAFQEIAARAAEAGASVATNGLHLIRTCLLDDQRRWLVARIAQHRKSSEWTTIWGGVATALAFLGGSGAVIASFAPNQAWMPIAGVLGAALLAYALNREILRRDRTNADRYENASMVLDEFAARLDATVQSIAEGNPETLVVFTEAITEQLASEHREWLEGAAQAQTLLARLDTQLGRLGSNNRMDSEEAANGRRAY